jgi:hypothetical protein
MAIIVVIPTDYLVLGVEQKTVLRNSVMFQLAVFVDTMPLIPMPRVLFHVPMMNIVPRDNRVFPVLRVGLKLMYLGHHPTQPVKLVVNYLKLKRIIVEPWL